MSHFSIASLQLSLKAGDNLSCIGDEICRTKKRFPWIDMVVLSELCSYGPDKKYAEQLPGKAELFYSKLAKKENLWIITGSQYEKVGSEIYNTASVIDNQGNIIERYRKIFPFYPYESGVCSGKDFVVFDVPQGRIGLAICYDLWFPEVARTLTSMGAEVILYPTLTGTIDRPAELVLAQSTSILNQVYTFSINASGDYGNGQSIITCPEGNIIYQAGNEQDIMPVEVDFSRVRRVRERGTHGLGQPLKSFRDSGVELTIYQDDNRKASNFSQLGALEIPRKSTDVKKE